MISNGDASNLGSWRPLRRILYGFAVYPFLPIEEHDEHGNLLNPYQVPLEIGSELYVFEVFRPASSRTASSQYHFIDEGSVWYRGYIVSSRQVSLPSSSAIPDTAGPTTEEPSVTIGIFPASYTLIKERLEDSDTRLEDLRQANVAGGPEKLSLGLGRARTREPLAPLLEEEDEGLDEDIFGSLSNNVKTPSKARNRASVPDARISLLGGGTPGHKRTPSNASQTGQTPILNGTNGNQSFEDNRPAPPLPSLKTGDETAAGIDEPLIDEIACALREYNALLYSHLRKRDYSAFHALRKHIDALHVGRKQLLGKTLSEDELSRLRKDLADQLVTANIEQGLNIVVRHPVSGALADVESDGPIDKKAWMSAVRMYKMSMELAYGMRDDGKSPAGSGSSQSVLGRNTFDDPARPARSQDASSKENAALAQFYHVFVDMRAFVANLCSPGESVELIFSLYNKADNRFLTEECCLILNHQGVPRDGNLDKSRMLFKDLSQQDIFDSLVLVCRIVINAIPMRSLSGVQRSSTNLSSPYGIASGYGSASFVSPVLPSTTSLDLRSSNGTGHPAAGPSSTSMTDVSETGMRTMRRPFGCAVVEISQLCKVGQSSTSSTELSMPIFAPLDESGFSTLHEDIIHSRIRDIEKPAQAENITIGVRVFHDDVHSVVRDNPSLMADTPTTARLGFPDVVFPDDQRNDLYIKLWDGSFPSLVQGGSKLVRGASNNIEVEVEVRNREGSTLGYCISRGAGLANVSRFTSAVFRNSTTPTWGELLKLELPPERMQDYHLFFTFRNRRDRTSGTSATASAGMLSTDRPFGFAYLPLLDTEAAFLPDGSHQLVIYRYDQQGAVPSSYFEGPDTLHSGATIPAALAKVLVPSRDSLAIRSFLCSTRITQDPTILQLISWERTLKSDPAQIKEALSKLRYSPEFECIKMITQIFESLFGILASQRNDDKLLDSLVFQAVVTLLSLVNDRRFANFSPVLDVYIDKFFASSTAFAHLMSTMHQLLTSYMKPESAQQLRSAIKVWGYLFRLVIRSRQNQRQKEGDMDVMANHQEMAFKSDLSNLLQDINSVMMASQPPSVIGTQTLAVQHFPDLIKELRQCFTSNELADITIAFYGSIASSNSSMAIQKTLLLAHIASGPLMHSTSARSLLIPKLVRWLKVNVGLYDRLEMSTQKESENAQDAARIHWLEVARLSVSTIAAILDRLHASLADEAIRSHRDALLQEHDNIEFVLSLLPRLLDTLHELKADALYQSLQRHRSASTVLTRTPTMFPAAHPLPLLCEPPANHPSLAAGPLYAVRADVTAVVAAALYISPVSVTRSYLESLVDVEGPAFVSRFLKQLFQAGTSLLSQEVFPSTWLNISMLAHKAIMKIADSSSAILRRYFVPEQRDAVQFDNALWRAFFDVLLKLLLSPSLIIEEFTPARQRAVWRLAGDLRGEGAKVLLQSWQALSWSDKDSNVSSTGLGGYQVGLGNIVESVLELCLSHHDELRSTAVRVLYSLILAEFHLNSTFHSIENEILDRLDKLFSHKKGDEISRAFFITQLRFLFEDTSMDERLRQQVSTFLDSVNYFLELLLGIRNLPESEEWQDDRVSGTLKLMSFIEKRHRSIYIRYVHRLVDYHVTSNQFVEAGLTLRLHADLYTFNTSCILPAMDDLDLTQQSEFGRKEILYLRMLELLSKGKAYESAISISKELQKEYESSVFAYQRLSELLVHQADLYGSIMNRVRQFPSTFRVAFYGRGFPQSVQDKQFVYRGFEWEKFGSFCERLQAKHSSAHVFRSADELPPDTQQSDGQFLLVTQVVAEPDRTSPIFTNPDVPPSVRAYYEHNETTIFSFSRQLDKVERALVDIAPSISQYQEKTLLRCAASFPSILARVEIVDVSTTEVSPIDQAITETLAKTSDLESLYRRFLFSSQDSARQAETGSLATNVLSMHINTCVDTGYNTGVPLYRRAFFDTAFITANPERLEAVERLRVLIDDHVRSIARCLKLHETLCPPDMSTFHASLIRFFERNFAAEIGRLGSELDYQPAQTDMSTAASPKLSNGAFRSSPQISESAGPAHSRSLSNATVTSSNPHLPFALPPLSSMGQNGSSGLAERVRGPGPLDRPPTDSQQKFGSMRHRASELPLSPVKASLNGVHFAPTPSITDSTGRSSPVPSTVPSTVNGAGSSEKSTSFLSRFNSIRRKK